MNETRNEKDFLKTLSKGMTVIKSFDREKSAMTLTEVAVKNNLSRASARRFLLTLKDLGYIDQENDRFRLTAKVLELGYQYLAGLNFIDVISPFMRVISQKLGKSCSAAILDGTDIVYIARISSNHQILAVNLHVGSRLPAYCTSMGRILLSSLSDQELKSRFEKMTLTSKTPYTITDSDKLIGIIKKIRMDGFALIDQELEESLRSIAIPIRNRQGEILCAINVGIPVGNESIEDIISTYLPIMREEAGKAELILGNHL